MNGPVFKSSLFKSLLPVGSFLTLLLVTVLITAGCSVESPVNDKAKLVEKPIVDQRLANDDFGFPSKSPSLKVGKAVFYGQGDYAQLATQKMSCASCHAAAFFQSEKVKKDLNVTTPIDLYLMLSTGEAHPVVNPSPQRVQVLPAKHPAFREALSRDDRWAVLFYARYLAGAGDMPGPESAPGTTIASIYGGNCAVCHGTRGLADGPLHVGRTGNHEIHNSEIKENLSPPPANFHDHYARMYNRSDAQILKYVCEGIYPSAMPSWYGNVHRDAATNKIVYVFDEKLITRLIRHVRGFAYDNDLPDADPEKATPPKGLDQFGSCQNVPTNQPWTSLMKQEAAKRSAAVPAKPSPAGAKQSNNVPVPKGGNQT